MNNALPFRSQCPSVLGKPWVICIHGLGMSEKSWTDPCAEALIDGKLSFDFILTDLDHPPSAKKGQAFLCPRFFLSPPLRLATHPPDSFWNSLGKEGWGLVAWSQKKPAGALLSALEELRAILEMLPAQEPVVLLAHSRGGLIARKYLQERSSGWQKIKAVIFLGTPHQGSQIAGWARSLESGRLASFLGKILFSVLKFLPFPFPAGFPSLSFRSLQSYLRNPAMAELRPNSPLIRQMRGMESVERENQIPYFNFIGRRTTYIRIYRQVRFGSQPMVPLFSLWDGLEKILPRSLLPPELRQGRGDGQVSVESALLPWASRNLTLPLNHGQLLVDSSVQNQVREILRGL
jgi:pimeloyl-ACP methyl ester carboxylesterase